MNPFNQLILDRFQNLHKGLIEAIDGLPVAALDWSPGMDYNSITRLVVHLTGAERFLFSDVILGKPSGRDRDAEFQALGWTGAELVERIGVAEAAIQAALETLSLADLEAERIHPKHNNPVLVGFAVLHALEHSAEHLGEIRLLRRLWQKQS